MRSGALYVPTLVDDIYYGVVDKDGKVQLMFVMYKKKNKFGETYYCKDLKYPLDRRNSKRYYLTDLIVDDYIPIRDIRTTPTLREYITASNTLSETNTALNKKRFAFIDKATMTDIPGYPGMSIEV